MNLQCLQLRVSDDHYGGAAAPPKVGVLTIVFTCLLTSVPVGTKGAYRNPALGNITLDQRSFRPAHYSPKLLYNKDLI